MDEVRLMRIMLLTSDHPTQVALAWKLSEVADLVGIVVSRNIPRRIRKPFRQKVNAVSLRLVGRPLLKAWREVAERYARQYPGFPPVPRIDVANVNDPPTLEALASWDPELVAVSGTNLVGRKIIAEAAERRGIINLHTGISPYVKGGPNCTNWCLATRRFSLIGNTVMWLDPGIDTGNIIATERTPLTGDEDLAALHWTVMEHAHDLYRRAIARIAAGEPVANVPQDELGTGPIYYMADWTATQMIRARWNFHRHYRAGLRRGPSDDRLIPLGP